MDFASSRCHEALLILRCNLFQTPASHILDILGCRVIFISVGGHGDLRSRIVGAYESRRVAKSVPATNEQIKRLRQEQTTRGAKGDAVGGLRVARVFFKSQE